ncbi:hypothetical protein BFP72_02095 [Reichenbachiella sp. 5M10]|uniref:BT_2262 family domain-containing protein n=1 Tax=Reichenbachiella sp. 5M10 TaxID=1889772 RepID=UPI000C14B193|nr:BT_2262 family domain-containing protein [Reichenbachiella sp. 5M10]PIB34306.1 hypothetical protein BFP72_02095 [Reichenbachiella sp. 5M10]
MKKINLIIAVFFVSILSSCGDLETEGVSRVTYFPTFESEGSDLVIVDPSETYSDVPVMATEDGVELEVTSVVNGRYSGYKGADLGPNEDEYVITYTATNGDGFPGSTTRTVTKVTTGDLVNSISGYYSCYTERDNDSKENYSNVPILIWETSPNVYEISCLVGGFYGDSAAKNYGDGYLCRGGTVTVNDLATNSFSFSTGEFPIWGNTGDIQSMTVDPATKTIKFQTLTDFGSNWYMTLVQIQPDEL